MFMSTKIKFDILTYKLCEMYGKPNLDSDYTFPIDLASNGILFGAKSTGRKIITIQIWFNLSKLKIEFSVSS